MVSTSRIVAKDITQFRDLLRVEGQKSISLRLQRCPEGSQGILYSIDYSAETETGKKLECETCYFDPRSVQAIIKAHEISGGRILLLGPDNTPLTEEAMVQLCADAK